MGKLHLINGNSKPKNEEMASSLRRVADIVENNPKTVASFGYIIAYDDGTIGIEYGGRKLTTLLGGSYCLTARIERELCDDEQ